MHNERSERLDPGPAMLAVPWRGCASWPDLAALAALGGRFDTASIVLSGSLRFAENPI